jgi:hypothetical protein
MTATPHSLLSGGEESLEGAAEVGAEDTELRVVELEELGPQAG